MSSHRGTEDLGPVQTALRTVRTSILLRVAVAGIVLILLGYLLDQVVQESVWAAILPTWGIALILVGVIGYVILWYTRQ